MTIVVYEDSQCDNLSPITLGRLAATISCGSFRLIDWLSRLGSPIIGVSRPHLRDIQRFDFRSWETMRRSPILNRAGSTLVECASGTIGVQFFSYS